MKKCVGFTLLAGMLLGWGCAEAEPPGGEVAIDSVGGDEGGDAAPADGNHAGGTTTGGDGGASGGDGEPGPTGHGSKADAGADPEPDSSLVRVTDACIENRDFVGQMYPKPTEPNNGGMVVTTPFEASYDAGIGALYAASPAAGELAAGLQIQITDATVTATGYGPNASKHFWVQDGKSAIHVRMATAVTIGGQDAVVKVGSRLSFRVIALRNYNGVLQVETADAFTFTGTEQAVYVDDRTGSDIAAADLHRLVRVTGVLSGAPLACGKTQKCWKFDYKGKTDVVFRSASKFIDTGACVTFVGPVGLFDGAPQLDTANFSWLWSSK